MLSTQHDLPRLGFFLLRHALNSRRFRSPVPCTLRHHPPTALFLFVAGLVDFWLGAGATLFLPRRRPLALLTLPTFFIPLAGLNLLRRFWLFPSARRHGQFCFSVSRVHNILCAQG